MSPALDFTLQIFIGAMVGLNFWTFVVFGWYVYTHLRAGGESRVAAFMGQFILFLICAVSGLALIHICSGVNLIK